MKTYARINAGVVVEIIEPMTDVRGQEIPISERFHPDFVATLVDVSGKDVALEYRYDDGIFSAPSTMRPSKEQQIAANTAALQAELDRQAQAKGYDNIISACSYAAQPPGAPFQAEGAAFLKWRSDVWSQAYVTLGEVEAGTRPMLTPEEAVTAMPALVLP